MDEIKELKNELEEIKKNRVEVTDVKNKIA
jgi:hypothetical protein